jgi:hypothetical protein
MSDIGFREGRLTMQIGELNAIRVYYRKLLVAEQASRKEHA